MNYVIIFGFALYVFLLFKLVAYDLWVTFKELKRIDSRIKLFRYCIYNGIKMEQYDKDYFLNWSKKDMDNLLRKLQEK